MANKQIELPIVIQCSNSDAEDAFGAAMVQALDIASYIAITEALSKQYRHVVAWDNTTAKIFDYDNR